jgi:hypothetical protein
MNSAKFGKEKRKLPQTSGTGAPSAPASVSVHVRQRGLLRRNIGSCKNLGSRGYASRVNLGSRWRFALIWGMSVKKHEPIKAADLQKEIQRISDVFRAKLQRRIGQTKQDWQAKKFAQFRMV